MDITLALGGGGAKGNAHIGVLRVLEQEGFRVRAVAGTSFGGIVAAFYAAGYSPQEIEEIFSAVDQAHLYGRRPNEGPALLGLAGVERFLDEHIGERTFDDLRIPCALTAVDLNSTSEIVLQEGKVKDAVLATIALPGIFPACHMEGYELVDGGVLDPVPVSVARSLAPSLPVVAVVLSRPVGEPSAAWSLALPGVPSPIAHGLRRLRVTQAMDVFLRSVEIGSRMVTELRLKVDAPDVVIRPKVAHIGLLQQVDVAEVARLGEEAAREVLPDLRRVVSWPNRLWRALVARGR